MSDSVKSSVSAKALIAEALAEQQLFTPVAEFGRREHLGLVRPLVADAAGRRQSDEGGSEARFSPPAHLYQDLIPLSQPGDRSRARAGDQERCGRRHCRARRAIEDPFPAGWVPNEKWSVGSLRQAERW